MALLDLLPTLWLDANDSDTITLDVSDNVEEWRDKSGNSNHFTQTYSGRRPDKVSGGVYFENQANNTSVHMADFKYLLGDTANVLKGPVQWIYAVFSPKDMTGWPEYHGLLSSTSAHNQYLCIQPHNTGVKTSIRNTIERNATKTFTYKAYKKYLLVSKYATASNRSTDVDESGSPVSDTNNVTAPSPTVTYLGLARTANGLTRWGGGWSGLLSEMLIFDSALSTEDHAKVVEYLTNKWSLMIS